MKAVYTCIQLTNYEPQDGGSTPLCYLIKIT